MKVSSKRRFSMDEFMEANIDELRKLFKDEETWDTLKVNEIFNSSKGEWVREVTIDTRDVATAILKDSIRGYSENFVFQVGESSEENCDMDVYMYDDGVNEETMIDVNPETMEYSMYL